MVEGPNRPLEGIERVKHAWPAGSWLESTVLLLLFSDFSRISTIFILADLSRSAAAAAEIS